MKKIQVICDTELAEDEDFKPKVTTYIQSPGYYGASVHCICDQHAPKWLRKEIDAICPNADQIMESMFTMPPDEFRELTKKHAALWFGSGKKLTSDEIEEYINLFKK